MKEDVLICLPTYHSPHRWLVKSIDSLMAQTYSRFECWIVKDGCRYAVSAQFSNNACLECKLCRSTKEFIKHKIKDDSRFKFFTLPMNMSGAGWGPRNFAILNTSHDLIAYLDDDNWYEPNHLKSLIQTMKESNADVVYTGTNLYDAEGENIVSKRMGDGKPTPGNIDTSEILHRRHLIEKYGGWRFVPKCNDWDMVKRWLPHASFAHTGKYTLNFRLRENCGVHRY